MEPKKLFRSDRDKMICGVCGGLGEYFNIDATIVRLICLIFAFSGPGVLVYIIAALVIPKRIG